MNAPRHANLYGLAGMLKEVRLWVNDTSNRPAVNSNGPALLEPADGSQLRGVVNPVTGEVLDG